MAIELCLAVAFLFSLAVITRRTSDQSLPLWSHYGSLPVLFLSMYPLKNGVSVKAFAIGVVGSALALAIQEASLRISGGRGDQRRDTS